MFVASLLEGADDLDIGLFIVTARQHGTVCEERVVQINGIVL